MFDALIQGLFLGLVLTVFVGPVFFMLVQTSVSQGIKAALLLDAGIVLSDISCIVFSYFGMAQVLENPSYRIPFGIAGGVIMVGYGVYTMISKAKKPTASSLKGISKAHGVKLFVKGFVFNTSVPSVIFFWIGTVSLAIAQFKNEKLKVIIFLSTVVMTYFAFDILKIYLASKAKKFFSGEKQHVVKRIAGIALIIFGAVIIYKVIMK